jgi:hypothetical protein
MVGRACKNSILNAINDWDTVASKASQVQVTMPDMSHVQATVSLKLAEVPNVQDAVVAKVTRKLTNAHYR